MKSSAILLVFFSLLSTALTYREREVFKKYIDVDACLGRLPGSPNTYGSNVFEPVGYTLESFISIVEKIESHHPEMDIFELTQMMLERFYFRNTYFTLFMGRRTSTVKPDDRDREDLLLKLLPRSRELLQPKFREEELTEKEKCSLYFMLSHNINDTFRKGVDDLLRPNKPSSNSQHGRRAREEGVVSLHSDPVGAVAMGKVLVGIAAGQYKGETRKLKQVGIENREHENLRFDILTALTLGDAISAAEFKGYPNMKYGPMGEWDSISCPSEYKLFSNEISITDAEIRGSIDGYILGLNVKELRDKMPDQLKLSRLIRAYYGRSKLMRGKQTVNFCDRFSILNEQHIGAVFHSVHTVFIYLSLKRGHHVEENSPSEFLNSFKHYLRYIEDLKKATKETQGYHKEYSICPSEQDIMDQDELHIEYETPLDLFVVLDVSEYNTRGWKDQMEVIGHLAGHLDIGNGAGSVTVLLNSRGGIQMDIKNETNSACATCKMTRMDLRNVLRGNIASVMTLINRTVTEFKNHTTNETAVPAKAVIVFHYGSEVQEDKKKLNAARRILRESHRDVAIYAVGTDDDILSKIATNHGSKISGPRETPVEIANRIREEIRKLPASLQYHKCEKLESKDQAKSIFHGYVTPKTTQLWALYPDYLLKNKTIEIRFKTNTTNGMIKVCSQKNKYNPSLSSQSECKKTGDNGVPEVIFRIKNPCNAKNSTKCSSINFSVEGLERDVEDVFQPACDSIKCRRTDQIKFTVTYKDPLCP